MMPQHTPTLLAAVLAASALPVSAETRSFNQDIRPILSDKCFACHGIDAAHRKGELRLDTQEGAFGKAESGAVAIKPGDPKGSELWVRINATDDDEIMPPPKSHKTISPAEKERIHEWIEQGAKYQKHWSFETPVKVALPATTGRNAVDAFIFDRLKREGLAPLPEADKTTLIRRVSFALKGLPPSVAEVDAFLADASPDAYEKLVDRLLASPQFGEEMARHWLDVARYGDTHGMHLDNERSMWLFRDWVVGAFNKNMPFSQFTIEQLAGDLLPNPTDDQLIATGFNRNNVTTGEGGALDAEFIFRYAVDRTSTTAQTWMGMTAGCAVCHDHKFDPLSQKEFYQLYAFFHSSADPAMDGNALLVSPTMKVIAPEQKKTLAEKEAQRTAAAKRLEDAMKSLDYVDPATLGDVVEPDSSLSQWISKHEGKDTKDLPADVNKILKRKPDAKRSAEQEKVILDHFLANVNPKTKAVIGPLKADVAKLEKEVAEFDKALPASFIMRDLDKPRDSFVMMRGAYDKPGDKVGRDVPAAFPPLPNKEKPTRLDLAKWLVADNHPLTARVTVNRFWQQFFGVGLVKTSGDFGSQGQPPSHPELLDWLAVDFRENGWNMKKIVRLLVTSATFRQSSDAPAALWKRDPENRLVARGPRLRLDAEVVRDNALAVSGLLDLTMGGRGVRPYQPPNIWEPVAYIRSNTANYKADTGNALYRRSLYTFLKRTAPPPFMANFDAPSREQSCAMRERSNTPLQALQLMNDVQHIEAARVFAGKIITQGGATPAERIAFAYRTALARKPSPEEIEIVSAAYKQHLAAYEQTPAEAAKFIRQGESAPQAGIPEPEFAAWTLIANLVLNLDETINRN
jgi:hypothetical protein